MTTPLSLFDPRFPSFLRLYRKEIQDRIINTQSLDALRQFDTILGKEKLDYVIAALKDKKETLRKLYPDMEVPKIRKRPGREKKPNDESEKRRMKEIERRLEDEAPVYHAYTLYAVTEELLTNKNAIYKLDKIIEQKAPELWAAIHLMDSNVNRENCKEFFRRFYPDDDPDMQMLDRVSAAIEPREIMTFLRRDERLRDCLKNFNPYGENEVVDDRHLACCFLRFLPRLSSDCGSDWFMKIAEACNADPYNRPVLRVLLPDYDVLIAEKRAEMDRQRRLRHGRMQADIEQAARNDIKEMRLQSEYIRFRKGDMSLDDGTAEPLSLRAYQEELVVNAKRGENTIISAPTGSGKTEACIFIALNHLRERRDRNEPARVAMIVPKIVLVAQQQQRFHKYMKGEFYSEGFSGLDMNMNRKTSLLACDVAVLTPQILVNMLNSVLDSERLYMCDFSMIIFDECHHCKGNDAYHELMRLVHVYNGPKPQILGLTASLAEGKNQNEESAMEGLIDVCANLSAESITTVVQHMNSLKEHVPKPDDVLLRADPAKGPRCMDYLVALTDAANQITSYLKSKLTELTRKNEHGILLEKWTLDFPKIIEHTKFAAHLERVKQELKRLTVGESKFEPIIAIEFLERYRYAVSLFELLPSNYSFGYLHSELLDLMSTNKANECARRFNSYYDNVKDRMTAACMEEDRTGERKPIIRLLLDALVNQFNEKPSSQALIFVEERQTAFQLCNYLNEESPLSKNKKTMSGDFGVITSAGAKTYSQTVEEQNAVFDGFRKGKIKVIVSTSVLDEGYDVPACNLIIKYNRSTTSIQKIQQSGRARASDSRSVLIVLNDSVANAEFEAIMGIRMMEKCMKKVTAMGKKAFAKLVHERMKAHEKQRQQQMENEKYKKEQLLGNRYDVVCQQCNNLICKDEDLRQAGSNFVCVSPKIWRNLHVTDDVNFKARDFMDEKAFFKLAQICCNKVQHNGDQCGKIMGKVVKYCDVYLPHLQCASLNFQKSCNNMYDETVIPGTQWTQAADLFFIQQINNNDLRIMLNALVQEEQMDQKKKLDMIVKRIQIEKNKRVAAAANAKARQQKKEEDQTNKSDW